MRGDSGFTLLELMIVFVIMIFISLGLYKATVETYRLRDILSVEGDFYNSIRMAMGIFQRDVQAIYSPQLAVPGDPGQPAPDEGELGASTRFWGSALDKTGIRPVRLEGTANRLSFVAVSHRRIYRNAPESEFAKIVYELEAAEPAEDTPEGHVLMKRQNANAFNEDDTSDDPHWRNYPLLRGVKTLKFRYYKKDQDAWFSSWDSDSAETKNRFPDLIEVQIEVNGPQHLSYDGLYLVKSEILNGGIPSSF